MKKWFEGKGGRRFLSLALSVVMVFSLLPMPSIAAESDGLCEHHAEHTEDCGYAAERPEVPCDLDCTDADGDGVIDHAPECAYQAAVEGTPCGFVCEECWAAQRIQAFLDAVAALDPDSPDADALLDAACEALDALEDEDRELPEVQEAMAALDEALGIIPEEAALYADIPDIPTVPQVYPSATMIKLKAVGFPSTTKAKVQKGQKFLNYDVDSASATEICLIVQYMGDASGTINLPKASDLWEYDTPNELLRIVWKLNSVKQEGDQVSFAYGLNTAEYDFKGTTVTYKLVYDLDGGEGNIPSASKTTDERECKFDVTTQTPTRAGYKFLGWAETRNAYTPSTKTSYTVKREKGTTKTLYAVWKALYTVTYTDGVDGVTLFEDQSHTVESGSDTPAFQGTPTRSGYVFDCWKSSDYLGGWIDWQNKVYNGVTYVAFWKEDRNNNGEADESETKYTITYQDGANGQYFQTQTFSNQLSGLQTPAFTNTVNRPYYVISGWSPSFSTKIAGNATYTAIWSKDDNNNGVPDEQDPKYTVTYVDGLNGAIFQPETHSGILPGLSTPGFTQAGTVKRQGYVLYGWNNWKSTVSGNVTYTAIWEPDINGNNKADKDEPKYTVTYKDDVNGAAFTQQQYTNQLINMPTPAFKGETKREGYVFDGWSPDVAETISGNATYTAKWELDENGNGVADRDDPRYTILYTDGVKNEEVFRDQVAVNCLPGIPTPAFSGTPTRKGYVFGGWSPEVEATVTDTVIYTAVWKVDANGNGIADEKEIWFIGDPGKTYDGTSVSMTGKYEVYGEGTIVVEYKRKDAADSAYSTSAPKDAGEYTVRVTKTMGADDSACAEKDFTIRPASVTISGITVKNKTYDGSTGAELVCENAVFDGKLERDTLTVTGTGVFADANAGEKKSVDFTLLELGGEDCGNYVIDLTKSQQQATASITVKPLSDSDITVTATNLTYTGTQQSPTVTVTYGTITLAENNDYTLSGNTATDAGTYTLTVTFKGNYSGSAAKTWKINKAGSSVATAPTAVSGLTYSGQPQTLITAGSTSHGKVVYSLTENGSYVEALPTGTNADSYTVWYKIIGDSNHLDSAPASVSCSIAQKSLTVKAKDHTITYGDAPANNGVTYSGFVNGETASVLGGTLAYDYRYSQYGNAGHHVITPKGLTSDNYDISFINGILMVAEKEIGITWGNTQFTYSGSEQKPAATPTGLVNNDAITLTVSGAQTNAGTDYTATVTAIQGDKAGNYALPQSVITTFSIAKAASSVATAPADTKSLYTGGNVPLVKAGDAEGGTMQYRLGADGQWSDAVPNAVEYGEYTVYYYVKGDGNHEDSAEQSVKARILPFRIPFQPKPQGISYGMDAKLSVGLDTKVTEGISYQWCLVTEEETGEVYTPLENETGKELTLTKPNAGTYVYACVVTCGDYSETSSKATVTVTAVSQPLSTTDLPDGLWVEGGEEPLNGNTIDLKSPSSFLLTSYTYNGASDDVHQNYPTGMQIYSVETDDQGVKKVTPVAALDNLLQYSGCSIRIKGKPGIRMITSLTKEAKAALTKANLAGYTLEEYGTVVAWSKELGSQPLTLSTGKSNYAYRKGVSDPVFANVGALTQYTNVLVWDSLEDAKYAEDIVMRPYIKLSNKEGETVTLYGGTVARSIGYVAQQNANTFPKGSAGYKYVHDIIDRVNALNSSTDTTTGGNEA